MREKSKTGEPTLALAADVTEAHRQVPIAEQDWHLLGLPEVCVNTVGTFGVASASFDWFRVGSTIGRLCQYLSGTSARTWHLLVADDYHFRPSVPGVDRSLFVLCSVLGVLLSWRKTAGGDTVSWVGFELLQVTQDRSFRKKSTLAPEMDPGDCGFRLRAYVKF